MRNSNTTGRAGAGASGKGKPGRKRSDAGKGTKERKPYERKKREDKPFDKESKPYERKKRTDKPFDSERKPYERKKRTDKPFDSERKPYERKKRTDKPFDSERKPYERKKRTDKPFDSERKPYERKKRTDKPFDSERKPYERKRREDKPFDKERKPYERKKRTDKPFDSERKPYERKRREDKPYDGERKPQKEYRYAEPFEFKRKPAIRNRKKKAESENSGDVRLNKFIANSGICSRREADEYIEAGLISVNGVIVTQLGIKVNPEKDDIRFNGERLRGEPKTYIVMNKPKDFVTTLSDPNAEKTVMDLISVEICPQRVYPVGRLDKQTTGVLLFTNDGELTEKLTHPSNQQKKIYHVFLDKNLSATDFDAILEGITLEDGPIHADALSYVDEEKDQVGLEIHSGRNRIVRRIFEHLGYKIKKLDRVYFAGLTKKNLKRGQWRFLTEQEVSMLKMGSYE